MPTPENHWSREPGRWEAQLTPEAWAYVPRIQAPSVSPDGKKVAYIRGFDGRSDVWVVGIDGGQPVQLTDSVTPQGPDPNQRQAFPLTWTPDSETVIFAASGEDKLWAVPAGGGRARQLEEVAGNHHSPEVSPDGKRVAFVAERGEKVDVFVASLDGTRVRQVSDPADDGFVANPHWSPDGSTLLYARWPHYDMPWDETAVVVASARQGTPEVIAGGERVASNWASWSPDGEWIAFTSDREGEYPNLWRMKPDGTSAEHLLEEDCDHLRPVWSPDGTSAEHLLEEDCDHLRPVWSPDGKKIAFTRLADYEYQIWVWERGKARQITSEPGVHSEVAWVDDEHLLCIFESPALPPDLWVVGLDGSRRQLTQSVTAAVLAADMARPEVLTWTSRDDLEVRGLLFEPSDLVQGRHPLVVFIHGGPVGVATKNWTPWLQYLVQRGYVVLVPNYRGSKGSGRSFMEALYGDWGGGDLDDNVTGAEAVIARGAVDPGRVVATGGSAGGYSTLICMTKAPDFFKAGIARYGIADLKTFHQKTWVFEKYYLAKLMGGTGGQHPDLYHDRSPINFVDDVEGPLLILQGDIDIVCHRSEMDKMSVALEKAGKDVEYVVYEGEGHGWRKISTIIDDAKRSDAFLTRAVLDS